jgi:two-component system cell cycle sensor histidine kinase/response regulator CckA
VSQVSTSLLSALLGSLPIGVLACQLDDPADDRSLRLLYSNTAARAVLHVEETSEGRAILEVFPAMPAARLAIYAGVCRTGEGVDLGTVKFSDPRLHETSFLTRAQPLPDRSVAIMFEPMSAQRLAYASALEASRFLDSIIEHVPAMVFLKEAKELRFVRFNRAGEELLGLPRAQLIGRNDHDFFPSEQASFFIQKDREVLRTGRLEDIPEEPIETPAGTRWLHTRKIPILDEGGQPSHLLGISIDITERKRAEEALRAGLQEQLRQAQKMEAVGRLAGGVAHDFNNLLSIVLSYSDLILSQIAADSPFRPDLEEVRRAGARAAELTGQLLAFSRQQVLQPRVLDLNEVLGGMERLLPRLLGEHIEIAFRKGAALRLVKADPSQLDQVLMNLVINARDAMPDGGKLTIETSSVDLDDHYVREHLDARPGPHVMLAVSDTGVGMDKATMARVFEPFFTTKETGRGTGLGLSTVFGIVKQSGGTVWVYSEPGQGTTFKVYLPAVTGAADAPRPALPTGDLRGHETVLLVEDEEQVRVLASHLLRRLGYTVLEARRAGEAITLASEHRGEIDLLLTDVIMPEMGGRLLAERVLAERPDIRVLFMSGYTDDAIVHHGVLDAGMAFLQKPLTPDSLARRVREVLSGS